MFFPRSPFAASHRPGLFPARGSVLLLVFLFVSASLAAQDPGMRPPIDTSGAVGRQSIVSIEGRVVAESEGVPLPGVHVTLTDFRGSIRGTYETRTGGAFSFSNLSPGRYTLTFSHPDFAEQTQTVEILLISPQTMIVTLVRKRVAGGALAQPAIPAWALQIPPRAQKEYDKGLEALEREDIKRSIVHLQAAVELYPRFATAYGALGRAHSSAGDARAAAEAFEKALEIDDSLFSAHLELGILHLREQRYAEAEKHLARAGALKPEDWRAQHQLGELYWLSGDWPKAEEKLRRAIELSGKLPRTRILLINVLAGQEKLPEALAEMENFLKLFPDDRLAPQVAKKRDLLRAELAKHSTSKEPKQP